MHQNDLFALRSRFPPRVCWFSQKVLNGFPPNFDGGRISAKNRPHYLLVWIQIKERIQEFYFCNVVFWGFFFFFYILINFSQNYVWILMEKQHAKTDHWFSSVVDGWCSRSSIWPAVVGNHFGLSSSSMLSTRLSLNWLPSRNKLLPSEVPRRLVLLAQLPLRRPWLITPLTTRAPGKKHIRRSAPWPKTSAANVGQFYPRVPLRKKKRSCTWQLNEKHKWHESAGLCVISQHLYQHAEEPAELWNI